MKLSLTSLQAVDIDEPVLVRGEHGGRMESSSEVNAYATPSIAETSLRVLCVEHAQGKAR